MLQQNVYGLFLKTKWMGPNDVPYVLAWKSSESYIVNMSYLSGNINR